jgi:hypothetical protein
MKESVLKLKELNGELKIKGKLLLENVYRSYINCLVMKMGDTDFENLILKLVDFRLSVSGGAESSMGSVGMNYIESFFDEIELILNLIDDWSGMYRGDWKYENLEEFKKCLDALEFDLLGENVSVNEEDRKLLIDEFIIRFDIEE